MPILSYWFCWPESLNSSEPLSGSGSRVGLGLFLDFRDRDGFEIHRFPDGGEIWMFWAVGERRAFANDDLASAAQTFIDTEPLIDVPVIGHSSTRSIDRVTPFTMHKKDRFSAGPAPTSSFCQIC